MQEVQENQFQSLGQEIRWRRNGNPFQYSCLENSMDKGAWQSMGLQSQTQLSD